MKKFNFVTLAFVLALPAAARAHHDYVWAKVIRVEPIVRHIEIRDPVEQCRDRERRIYYPAPQYNTTGSTLAGGLIGGAIGSQIGRGDERIFTTVAGGILGAAIGHAAADHGNRYGRPHEEIRHVRDCRIIERTRTVERIDGYWVDYKYRGRVHRTRMDEPPGKKIHVRVGDDPMAR